MYCNGPLSGTHDAIAGFMTIGIYSRLLAFIRGSS